MDTHSHTSAFYAYASEPVQTANTVRKAIESSNALDSGFTIIDWSSLNAAGSLIIDRICDSIDRAEVFICDLTSLNHNVLFELGYAMAKRKPVWITMDERVASAKRKYRELTPLATLAYLSFSSEHELQNRILDANRKENAYDILLERHQGVLSFHRREFGQSIFYMKCHKHSDASIALDRRLDRERKPIIVDDPQHSPGQSLDWYIEHTYHAFAILAHLDSQQTGEAGSNGKYSLAAGLAYGFRKPLLILAHAPFSAPIDYHDITRIHRNSRECVEFYDRWFKDVDHQSKARKLERREVISAIDDIRNVDIGYFVAENEEASLPDYFVETAAYQSALENTDYELFVGRKGTGKTANLYMLANHMRASRDCHVCLIRPIRIELEGIYALFSQVKGRASLGYLLNAIWKFLVYTELTKSVYDSLQSRPNHYQHRHIERQLLEFVDGNQSAIGAGFSERLEYALRELCEMEFESVIIEGKKKVSEILHDRLIGRMRQLLGELLSERDKVLILVDNLDENWEHRSDLPELGDFLFGLIGVSREIAEDFKRRSLRAKKVQMSLILFLRSDIFYFIKRNSREADKVAYSCIDWNDPELLIRVVEKRFQYASGEELLPGEIWNRYFTKEVDGVRTDKYIMNCILPRPRDLIYLCRAALVNAKNRKHQIIEERDVLDAEQDYSRFALELLLAEVNKETPSITKQLLFEFLGEDEILTDGEIGARLKIGGIHEADFAGIIETLVNFNFFAVETGVGEFTFMLQDDERDRITAKARKLRRELRTERYQIHRAFKAVLELESSDILRNVPADREGRR